MEVYREIVEPLAIKEYPKDYSHFYGNPFREEKTAIEVLNLLVRVSKAHILGVEESWAYAYAMAIFGTEFFPKNVEIRYIYETKDDWDYGVPREVIWEYRIGEIK